MKNFFSNWLTQELFDSSISQTVYVSGGGTKINKFIDLNDVPKSYAGKSGYIVRVKNTEDGLEFDSVDTDIDWGDIGGNIINQVDLQNVLNQKISSELAIGFAIAL